jgi:hypothetical protein
MKLILSCTVVLMVMLAGICAQAQGTLVPYDKFESKLLNPDLWFGSVSTSTGGSHLESATQIKTEPTYGMGVDLLHRGYGSTDSNSLRAVTRNRLYFSDGTGITTIQGTVQVKKVQATGCLPANPNPTDVQARMGGFFFNTVTTTPGDSTNDVGAFIVLRRRSNSTDASNVLEVVGYAIQCTIDDCSTSDPVGSEQSLGTARVGQRIKLRITWDQAGNRFVFQKGKSPEVPLGYSLTDTFAPGSANGGAKRLDIQEIVANCTTQPRPVGYMEVYFDNVYVNAIP